MLAAMVMVPMVNAKEQATTGANVQLPHLQPNDSQPRAVIQSSFSLSKRDNVTEIAVGSIIQHTPDGVTRVFDSYGKQISVSDDSVSTKILTPKGYAPASFVYEVPNGSVIKRIGNDYQVLLDNKTLFSIVNPQTSSSTVSTINTNPSFVVPEFGGWLEEANYSTISNLKSFSASWTVPARPSNTRSPAQINIFPGVESTTSQQLAQPVLMWNNSCPQRWCGQAWYITTPSHSPGYFYSSTIPANQGDEIDGLIQWQSNLNYWLIGIKDINQLQAISIDDPYFTPYNVKVTTALEPYHVTLNSDLPGDTTFYNMQFLDLNNNPISFTWNKWYSTWASLFQGVYVYTPSQSTVTLYTDW
jgi:hypothetical protein